MSLMVCWKRFYARARPRPPQPLVSHQVARRDPAEARLGREILRRPHRSLRLRRAPPRRASHRPCPPAPPVPGTARRLGGLRGASLMGLVPYLAPATLDAVMRLVLDAVSSPSTR